MIRGIRRLLVALLVWLVILYGWPIIQRPMTTHHSGQHLVESTRNIRQAPLIKAQGPARLINQPAMMLIKQYGQPVKQALTDEQQQRWLFRLNSRQYIEALIDNQTSKTQQITVIGADNAVPPFKFAQKRTQLSKKVPLATHFGLALHEQKFELRLTPEQQQSNPLIAFKNHSFASLIFQQARLTAVIYLNANCLLQANWYQVVSKTPIPVDELDKVDQPQVALNRRVALLQTLQTLRQNNDQPELVEGQAFNAQGQQLMTRLKTDSKQVLNQHGQKALQRAMHPAPFKHRGFLTGKDMKLATRQAFGVSQPKQLFYWPQPLNSQTLLFEQQQNLPLQLAIHNQQNRQVTLICTAEQTIMFFE